MILLTIVNILLFILIVSPIMGKWLRVTLEMGLKEYVKDLFYGLGLTAGLALMLAVMGLFVANSTLAL